MEKELKISILTPSFNQSKYIAQNIESVLNQQYSNFEHIVMDGESSDDTKSVLQSYQHLLWKSEPDHGQADALIKAMNLSTGDIIGWINSDDFLAPGSLEIVNDFFVNNPDKYVLVGNLISVDEGGHFLFREGGRPVTYDGMLNAGQCVQQPSTFFRRQVLKESGLPDDRFHYTMDREFFIRIAKFYPFYCIDHDLACFRRYSNSKTGSNQLGFIKDLIRVKAMHNADFFSVDNLRLLMMFIKEPFKRSVRLRRIVRRLKGLHPDFIHYPNVKV